MRQAFDHSVNHPDGRQVIPKIADRGNHQLKAQSIPLNTTGVTTPDGWRGSGAPRRPERLMLLIFCLKITTIAREGRRG
jgi:hypothetical protein